MEINSQIDLWRGEFGNEYAMRNAATAERVRNQTRFWAKLVDILARRSELPSSILEVGANVGINLRALGNLVDAQFYAVEPNENACATLVRDRVAPAAQVLNTSGEAIALPDASVDMVFTAGVLIHVNPNNLSKVCSEIYRVARKIIVCAEYFNAFPETVVYRGHDDKLFKRDFGSFWLEQYPSLKLIDYGFAWKPVTGLDNITWWMFAKAA